MPKIVVLGAGVAGLTSALLLAKDKENIITVVAKHMPGDYDAEYTSPWAGANVLPMASEEGSRYERATWPVVKRLAAEVPESGIHFQKSVVLRREKDAKGGNPLSESLFDLDPWFRDLFDDYRELDRAELPAGVASACEFTSVQFNTALYLPWLVGQCLARGVVFKRAVVKHVGEAALLGHASQNDAGGGPADVVVNATGLLACRLGGVMDARVQPGRGQIVVVRNEAEPMMCSSGTDDGPDELFYVMMRAGGGGTVLGGTCQMGSWDALPDHNVATRIMARAVREHPALAAGGRGVEGLDVIRHSVGLRPYREGGVRIERERIGDVWVVHNYGHAGWGYQGSYGCADAVVELVNEVLAEKGIAGLKV